MREKEAGRWILLLLPCLLLTVACAKRRKPDDAPKKKADPLPVSSVGLGAGYTTVYQSKEPNAPPSFSLKWTQGALDAKTGTVESGRLENPSGQIFQEGKPASAYRSDVGKADRAAKRLNMEGHVVLRSLDQTQTLRSAHGEYRGDVKLLRAMGDVVATGPFGTLSGVPELWATPDFSLIGTPDMVSHKLKIPALAALAATAALGSPRFQKGTTYDFVNQGPTLAENLKTGLRLTIKPNPGAPLVVKLLDRGTVVESVGPVVVEFAPGSRKDVRHLVTTGKVHVVQTTKDVTTTMDGKDAVYDWDDKAKADTANLDLAGPVTIVRTAKVKDKAKSLVDQTTTTKGDQGSAVLANKPKAGEDGLKRAVLVGHVTLDVSPVDGQSASGEGDRLVYTPNGDVADVDLTGNTTLRQIATAPDGSRTLVAKGARSAAVLFARPAPATNPLKSAVMKGDVILDVSGSNGETFKGKGDQLVYTAEGEGGKAVMTGALQFFGDAKDYSGDLSQVDTATMVLGKDGWQSVETTGKPTHTTIQTKTTPPAAKPPKAKGKKGGKP